MDTRVGTAIKDTLDRILAAGKAYDEQHDGPAREYHLRPRYGFVEAIWENGPNDPHRITKSGGDIRMANMRLLDKIERENERG